MSRLFHFPSHAPLSLCVGSTESSIVRVKISLRPQLLWTLREFLSAGALNEGTVRDIERFMENMDQLTPDAIKSMGRKGCKYLLENYTVAKAADIIEASIS